MEYKESSPQRSGTHYSYQALRAACLAGACCIALVVSACNNGNTETSKKGNGDTTGTAAKTPAPAKDSVIKEQSGPLDTALYNKILVHLANRDSSGRWPVKTAYPNPGAILPFKRVLAYYGNLYSKKMGALGEYPPDEMLRRLQAEGRNWAKADTTLPIQLALHYIAVTAQGSAGKDGKYRARMPFKQIDSILHIAARINAIVFLDIQVGFSNVQTEVPMLEKYLKMPNVHLGIDAEFAMHPGQRVGHNVGTFDAADVNFASNYLVNLVKANNLPPKILIVHRWTRNMITNWRSIHTHPEVQIVMDMDGWGPPDLKYDTYRSWVGREPVQFTGFKLFYKNDIRKPGSRLLTPKEVLALKPSPIYIQYQ